MRRELSRSLPLLLTIGMLGGCDGSSNTPTPSPTASPTPSPTPTPTPPAGVADACPSGTTDAGIVGNRRACELPLRFTQDARLKNLPGVAYSIKGRVNVGTDVGGAGTAAAGQAVTLTIEPGAVLFGSADTDYLIVGRGSRINAAGTANNPILFTAKANLTAEVTDTSDKLWGGIILLGRAPIGECEGGGVGGTASCERNLNTIAADLYGGALDADSSGTLSYLQIRFAGAAPRVNTPPSVLDKTVLPRGAALALAGVGGGTTIDHVQVHNSGTDAFQILGGRVNLRHLVAGGPRRSALFTDLGYRGAIQYFVAVQRDVGEEILKAGRPEDADTVPRQQPLISNATLVYNSMSGTTEPRESFEHITHFKVITILGSADYSLVNSVITAPDRAGCLNTNSGIVVGRAADPAKQEAGPALFRSNYFSCLHPTDFTDYPTFIVDPLPLLTVDPNNRLKVPSSLTNTFVDGANELAVPVYDPRQLSPFMQATSYIGAVRDTADTWYSGWTCSSSYLPFGGQPNCNVTPPNA
jgi:hypothetical protein